MCRHRQVPASRTVFGAKVLLTLGLLVVSAIRADSTNTSPGSTIATTAVGIERFVLKTDPIAIPGATNCSGIAFNSQTRTLFVVANSPTEIYELEMDGKIRRTIELTGFDDTEDIAFVGERTFGVLEEKRRNLCLVDIPSNATSVAYANAVKFPVDPVAAGNSGPEGVTYDAAQERFFVVKEKNPRRIYMFSRPDAHARRATVTNPWDIETNNLKCRDLSGIHYHAGTGHLLILSDESKCVVETTLEGEEIARLSLVAGFGGLSASVPQPEGITVDDEENLYVCSEPNLLYIYSRKK